MSGIVWRADLVVAPAERLVRARTVEIAGLDGRSTAQLVALDLATDVAVVRCNVPGASSIRAASVLPATGETVAVVGRESGELAADWRSIRKVGGPWRSRRGALIDSRIELDGGQALPREGSAILAADGGIIGMAVHGPHRRVLAIPTATIERVVAEVAAHGQLRLGYLGVSVLPLPLSRATATRWQTDAGSVLLVADLDAESPAAAAGIDVGDVLTSADGTVLDGVSVLTSLVRARGPGGVLRLTRRRGALLQELAVTLGERTSA